MEPGRLTFAVLNVVQLLRGQVNQRVLVIIYIEAELGTQIEGHNVIDIAPPLHARNTLWGQVGTCSPKK